MEKELYTLLDEVLTWMIENDYECGPRGSELYSEIYQTLGKMEKQYGFKAEIPHTDE